MMNNFEQRSLIVKTAQQWLDTPYRHQGTSKGIGCDCLGLVRGIWRELYGYEPEQVGPYSLDWAEANNQENLLEAAQRHFILAEVLQQGSLIVFRWRAGCPAKHLGIYVGEGYFIHAYERSAVVISPLIPQWRRRIAGIFDFPQIAGV